MAGFGKRGHAWALACALAASPALAEDPDATAAQAAALAGGQVTDCVAFVREQRDLARENDVVMSRREQSTMLDECEIGILQARLAEQQRILAALDERLAALNLRLNEQSQILDENNQVIGFITAMNGQLVIQRQLETDIAQEEAAAEAADAVEARIAAAEARIAAADARIAAADARTEAAEARTEAAEAEIAASRARQEQMLREAERILQGLTTR